jgi:cytochrome c-type biogenesis protein CcmF
MGEARIVGRGYYDFFLRVFGLPLLVLMGIGPLVAWRRASLRSLGAAFAWPAGFALLTGLVLLALGAGSSIPGLIAYTFSAFVLGSIAFEFVRGTRARRALSGGSWPGAFSALVARNRRRYGGYVVHAAVVLLAIGIAGSSAYDSVSEGRLARGDALTVGDYRLTYRALQEREAANATEVRAVLDVERDGKPAGTVEAGKNAYTAERQVSNEVGIRSDLVTGEDLFVIAEQVNPDGTVYLRVFVKPLVNLIWLAGLVFLLGSLITLWPDAREQRRLAVRYGGAETPVRP